MDSLKRGTRREDTKIDQYSEGKDAMDVGIPRSNGYKNNGTVSGGLSSSSGERNPGHSSSSRGSGGRDPGMTSSSGDDRDVASPPAGLRRWSPAASRELQTLTAAPPRQFSTSSDEDPAAAGLRSARNKTRRGGQETDGSSDVDQGGVYLTREPLANRPPVVFEDKPMDVDIDIHSYKQ